MEVLMAIILVIAVVVLGFDCVTAHIIKSLQRLCEFLEKKDDE